MEDIGHLCELHCLWTRSQHYVASWESEVPHTFILNSKTDTGIRVLQPFECLYKMLAEEERIDAIKPRQSQGEFSDVTHTKDGDMVITNERYKTRVRASNTVSPIEIISFSYNLLRLNPPLD